MLRFRGSTAEPAPPLSDGGSSLRRPPSPPATPFGRQPWQLGLELPPAGASVRQSPIGTPSTTREPSPATVGPAGLLALSFALPSSVWTGARPVVRRRLSRCHHRPCAGDLDYVGHSACRHRDGRDKPGHDGEGPLRLISRSPAPCHPCLGPHPEEVAKRLSRRMIQRSLETPSPSSRSLTETSSG